MNYNIENDNLLNIVKTADTEELKVLCQDIREFLVDKISVTGGHLASNLGVVELTVALHRIYNSPEDKIIFDVGHQAYVHKILTGRADQFDTLRQYKGLSGFPKLRESEHDQYETGHSSTSISAAHGLAVARDIKGEKGNVIAVIGDGSMTGGIVYEALNNIGASKTNVKIILNDNGMSISHNVGSMSKHLTKLRTSKQYLSAKTSINKTLSTVPVVGSKIKSSIHHTKDRIKHSIIDEEGALFEDLGIKYIGPVNGHNLEELQAAIEASNKINGPTIVHAITVKGMGYEPAELNPSKFHGVGPFNKEDGSVAASSEASYSKVFGNALCDYAAENKSIVAITAAMGDATGLGPFGKIYPDRFFDVGIAEQHAVVFAAGLARNGLTPVVAIYSSFMQRAIDFIIEDVCLQNQHVVFALDRAGLVGADGETHHGMYDISYLSMIPNLEVYAPAGGKQLAEILDYAVNCAEGAVAIRYPRGSAKLANIDELPAFTGENITLNEGKDVTILAVGNMLDTAIEVADALNNNGISTGVKNICVIKPFDNSLKNINSKLVVTIEDNSIRGGFGEMLALECADAEYEVISYAIPDEFIEHGSVSQLRKQCGLDTESIVKGVSSHFEREA